VDSHTVEPGGYLPYSERFFASAFLIALIIAALVFISGGSINVPKQLVLNYKHAAETLKFFGEEEWKKQCSKTSLHNILDQHFAVKSLAMLYTGKYCFHNCTDAYIPVHTGIYAYRPFCMRSKQLQTGLEPTILCILLAEDTPSLQRFRPEHRDMSSAGMYVYIHCHCNTAGLCTWCLVTN
jgi:hypothetical protein